jgi:hypothetical protein|nr:MAG TPA: hypothetical protein [Caudoviricetes sp.]
MRLIDADELKQELYQEWFLDILLTQQGKEDMFRVLAEKIDNQPTAYDLDEVLERLQDESKKSSICELPTCKEDESHCCYCDGLNKAIEIVKAVSMNNNSKNTRKDG